MHVIKFILAVEPRLDPVYPINVELAYTYMWLWVHVEDTPVTDFFIPSKNKGDEQFVSFHLSPPIGFCDSAPFFCTSMEAVIYMENNTILGHFVVQPHVLEGYDGNWYP